MSDPDEALKQSTIDRRRAHLEHEAGTFGINIALLANKLEAAAIVCFSFKPPLAPDVFMRHALASYAKVEAEHSRSREEFIAKYAEPTNRGKVTDGE
jgi:hypothetical protein